MNLPIPEPLRGADLGTFAHYSVVTRLPEIANRTIGENDFSPEVVSKIKTLIGEIPEGKVRSLDDPAAPDAEDWNSYVSEYLNHDWLQVPWFFAEFYFYRRILEASGYFQPEHQGYQRDPYRAQKELGFKSTEGMVGDIASLVGEKNLSPVEEEGTLRQLLKFSLWGNQADLSMWPIEESGEGRRRDRGSIDHTILVDQRAGIIERMMDSAHSMGRMDIIVDNAGFEFVIDLLLADYLLSRGLFNIVHFHPKSYPIFVSDVVPTDLDWTLESLASSPLNFVRASVDRLHGYMRSGRLAIQNHTFWTSPLAVWKMPNDLYDQLGQSDLVLFKGDMNYRRLLGDRHWDYGTPFEEIVSYFPASIAAVRALKSEVVCGLGQGQAEATAFQDPQWMINGNWGVIQFRR